MVTAPVASVHRACTLTHGLRKKSAHVVSVPGAGTLRHTVIAPVASKHRACTLIQGRQKVSTYAASVHGASTLRHIFGIIQLSGSSLALTVLRTADVLADWIPIRTIS